MGIGQSVTSLRAVLTFLDAFGNKGVFSVPRAKAGTTAAEAEALMKAMLATGALKIKDLDPMTAAKGAKLVSTERTLIAGK